jgi:hypothetical protein
MGLVLDIAVMLLVAIGVLGGCGMLWRPLLPWRTRPFLTILAPFLGFALVSGICHVLGAAGLPLIAIAWPVVGLALAGWAMGLARWRLPRPRRELLLVCAVGALAFLLAALPVLALGYLTSVGFTSDAVSYAARSEYLQHAPLQTPIALAGQPFLGTVRAHLFVRAGDVYLLGLLGLLTGHRSFELLTLLMALFFGLTPGAVFVWARLGLRLRRGAALLAAGLVGINNLLLWAVFDNFLSQVVGSSLFPLAFVFAVEGRRQPGWRSAVVFGALLATLASVYPVYAVYALASAGIYWLAAWLPAHRWRELPRHAAWWLTAAGGAVLLNGVALYRSFQELGKVTQLLKPQGAQFVGAGDILVFPSYYEIGGLVCHAAAAMLLRLWPLPRGTTSLVALAAAAFALYGWWRLAPRLRLAAAVLLLAGAALAAHQRFGVNLPDGYPYGYFKAVSILPLEAMALVAAGLAAAWRRPVLRVAAVLALLAIAVLNLMNSLWSARYTFKSTILTRDVIEAAQAPAALPAAAWVLMDVPSPPLLQTWIGYLWRDRVRIASRGAPLPAPAPFFRWAFVERQLDRLRRRTSTEPWYDPEQSSVVWQTPRFVLRERRDALMATMTWESPVLHQGETFELALAPERRRVAGKLAGRGSEAELAAGTPRRIRISAFGPGDAKARLEVDGAAPVTLGAGGWVLDFDLGCRRQQPPGIGLRNAGPGDVLVSEIKVLGSLPAAPHPCLDVEPLGTGAAYVDQQLAPPRIRYRITLWPPRDDDQRRFHLGVHVANVASGASYGVWSVHFPGGRQAHRGSLEIDLADGRGQGEVDGRPAPVEVVALNLNRGSYGLSSVIWQLQPLAQVSVDNLLWFNRTADGAIVVSNASPHSPLTIIPSKLRAPP